MKISLAYGKQGLEIEVPDKHLEKVLIMPGAPPVDNVREAFARAVDHPISTGPLREAAAGARSACIAICDITRPVPNKDVLPSVLEVLESAGIPRQRITILVATGLHRPSREEEIIRLVGEDIRKRYLVVDHHARIENEHRFLGKTERGTPIWIDRRYCEAEFKMTVATIEPHLMAGFSGGRKMVAPGCAGEETIKVLHSPYFLEDPRCREGNLSGNPLHEELLEIAGVAGQDFIVDMALNARGEVTGIFAGHPQKAHEAGVEHVRNTVLATVERPVDIVVTTAAGYPLDLTYYQSIKGMTAALPVVRRGGTLILAAECAEGLGNAEFRKMATSFSTPAAFRDWILSNPVHIDQWQLEECAKAALQAEVVLVSDGIPPADRDRLFVRSAPSVGAALTEALMRHGETAKVAVIPKGPYTLVAANEE